MPDDEDEFPTDPWATDSDDDTPGFERGSDTSRAAARRTNTTRGALEVIGVLRAFHPEPLCAFEIEAILRSRDPRARAEDPRKSNIGSRLAEMFDSYCLDMPGVARNTGNNSPAQAYMLWEDLTDEQLVERYGEARRAWNRAVTNFEEKFDRPRPALATSYKDTRSLDFVSGRFNSGTPQDILDRVQTCIRLRETNHVRFTRQRTHVTIGEHNLLRAARAWMEGREGSSETEALFTAIRTAYGEGA